MAVRTLGVEEEMLLFDARTGLPAPRGDEMTDAAAFRGSGGPGGIRHEFKLEQVETSTLPCAGMDELYDDLTSRRRALADRAAELGAQVAALATCPLPVTPTPTPGPRYRLMQETFGVVARSQLVCGMHVHVAVASPEEGVAVIDRVRCWLPLLLALSANSPYWQGTDTGLASFRTVSWSAWPTAGPTDVFGSESRYRAVVDQLIDARAALDAGMVYFDARLSHRYPTVEIRVPDVCLLARDAVLVAILCRALVDTAAAEWHRGQGPAPAPRAVVRAASWQAARDGVSGSLLDPVTFRPVDAARATTHLLEHTAASLIKAGDLARVEEGLARVLADGTGADRQRAVGSGGDLAAVVRDAVEATSRP